MEDGELSASDREESAREDEDEFTGGGGGSHAEVEAVSEGSDNDSEEVKGVFQDEEEEQEEDGDRINEEKLRTLGVCVCVCVYMSGCVYTVDLEIKKVYRGVGIAYGKSFPSGFRSLNVVVEDSNENIGKTFLICGGVG